VLPECQGISMTPILFTNLNCSYAIRARMAMHYSGVHYELREVELQNFPEALTAVSTRGTVPVLHIAPGEALEESIEIMHWAVLESDPDGWIDYEVDILDEINDLIHINDHSFTDDLETYKTSKSASDREKCCLFLDGLEERLEKNRFLFANRVSLADFAIFPFICEFSCIEPEWFLSSHFNHLKNWLRYHEESPLFQNAMKKYPTWREGAEAIMLPC
jgi:glutathione S-transferase